MLGAVPGVRASVGRTCGLDAGTAADGAAEDSAVAAVALSMLGARMPSLKSREDGHVEDVTATTTLQSSASALASAASKVAEVTTRRAMLPCFRSFVEFPAPPFLRAVTLGESTLSRPSHTEPISRGHTTPFSMEITVPSKQQPVSVNCSKGFSCRVNCCGRERRYCCCNTVTSRRVKH